MRNRKIGVSALAPAVLTVVTIAIANPPGRTGQQDPTPQIPKTWDDQAMATLELPLANAAASPVPVSAEYYYRIPVRPIYQTYPVYHPSKEPSGYFERLQGLESLAAADAARGQAVRAARLCGAADQLLESVGVPLNPFFRQLRDRYFGGARKASGERAFEAARSDGRAMSLTQAVQYALSVTSYESVPRDRS
jgi:hypothetical protein